MKKLHFPSSSMNFSTVEKLLAFISTSDITSNMLLCSSQLEDYQKKQLEKQFLQNGIKLEWEKTVELPILEVSSSVDTFPLSRVIS